MLFGILYNHPLFIASIFVGLILSAIYNLGARFAFTKLKLGFLFCLATSVLNPLLNHRGAHIVIYLFDKPITLESIIYSGYIALLLSTMLVIFVLINHVVGTGKILYLFSKTLPQIGFVLSMTLRYTRLLKQQVQGYAAVQNNRSVANTHSRTNKLREATSVLAGFATYVLENGLKTAQHLRANEYGSRKRTLYLRYSVTGTDMLFIVAMVFICSGSVFFRGLGAGTMDYYKNITDIKLQSHDIWAYLLLITYQFAPYAIDFLQIFREKNTCH